MNYKKLLLLITCFSLSFIYLSCDKQDEIVNPEDNTSLDVLETKIDWTIDDTPREGAFTKVDAIGGKTGVEYYREFLETNDRMINVGCGVLPDCPSELGSGSIFIYGCTYDYTYTVYDCGFGNVVIQDLSFSATACASYTYFLNGENDFDYLYHVRRNTLTAAILNKIEDELIPTIDTPNDWVVIASYIKNPCFTFCGGLRESCDHDDCCLRFTPANIVTNEKSVYAFSNGECGIITPDDCETCQSYECINLDE